MVDPAHPLSSIEKPKPSVSSDDGRAFRRLPGTRWSAIRLNWRWMVQGLALIAGIFFFMRAFNTSKTLWMSFSWLGLGGLAAWILLFGCCFAVLLFTSYLKERGTRTLRHRITV
ncbi:MAG: hypothetical protein ONA90_05115, partial [candidate division KSB1 bacterium]|nr:hypothetical protein [candidate division KSB1 bacterium]